jgi:hypothetical protein
MANFVRGRGDMMGVAGNLNDNADITAPVFSYWPNDYGLYNMAGNVSEWVMDVYRPLSGEEYDEFRPFRGNVFKTKVLNSTGSIAEKYDETMYDVYGIKQYLAEFELERLGTADRKYTKYPHGPRLDSLERELLKEVNTYVDEAIKFSKEKQPIEASRRIREIFDNVFDDFDNRIQQNPDFIDYSLEISPMLRSGISEYVVNTPGNVKVRETTAEENLKRRNYRVADNIDELDGDINSSIYYPSSANGGSRVGEINAGDMNEDWVMYQSGKEKKLALAQDPTSLISDKSKVFKGGSWRDRVYWLSPGTRRFLDHDLSTANIGFRCAMDRVGSPIGLGDPR